MAAQIRDHVSVVAMGFYFHADDLATDDCLSLVIRCSEMIVGTNLSENVE